MTRRASSYREVIRDVEQQLAAQRRATQALDRPSTMRTLIRRCEQLLKHQRAAALIGQPTARQQVQSK